MFYLPSARLHLIPLTYKQLLLLAKDRNALERSMGLNLSNLELNAGEDFLAELARVVMGELITKVQRHRKNFEWFTHWLIVHKEKNLTIGGIGGTGLPDEKGRVMVGYYIDRKFEGQGYATEALGCLLHWMFQNEKLTAVIADTLVDGFGSQKVLQQNGFVLVGAVEEGLRWQRNRP